MSDAFARQFMVGWGDADVNGHMRNTAFLDYAANIRMLFFAARGFPMSEFARLAIGPVIAKDEVLYFREFRMLDEVRVTLATLGMSEDGSRFRLRNEFFRPDGRLAAQVTSDGGWLDLKARRLVAPPPALLAAMAEIPRDPGYESLETSLKPEK